MYACICVYVCVYVWSRTGSCTYRQHFVDVDVGSRQMDVAVLRRRSAHRLPSVRLAGRRLLHTQLGGEGDGGTGVERKYSAARHVRGRDAAAAGYRLHGQRGGVEPVRCRRSSDSRRPHSAAQCPWVARTLPQVYRSYTLYTSHSVLANHTSFWTF